MDSETFRKRNCNARGLKAVIVLVNALLGLPPVVVGLAIYLVNAFATFVKCCLAWCVEIG
jgi:ABC-type tungstate transport system substrate-binding protein